MTPTTRSSRGPMEGMSQVYGRQAV
jgi:hypothetical protein